MISTSELFDIGSGIKRICEENRLYLDALVKKDKEIERLREALQKIVDFDWQFKSDGKLGKIEGPCAAIARSALQQKENE